MDLYHRNILLSPLRLSPTAEPRRTHMLLTLPHRQSRDLLARALANRPSRQELSERGLVPKNSEMGSHAAKIVKSLERRRLESALETFFERTHAVSSSNTNHSPAHSGTVATKSNGTLSILTERNSLEDCVSGTSIVIVKRRNYLTISPDQHILPQHALRNGRRRATVYRDQSTRTSGPSSQSLDPLPLENEPNSNPNPTAEARAQLAAIRQARLETAQARWINADEARAEAEMENERYNSTANSRQRIQELFREEAMARQEEQEEYFIRKSVRALASMYTFTTSWLSQPPPPRAPPLPGWLGGSNYTGGEYSSRRSDEDASFNPLFIDSRSLVPLTPYMNHSCPATSSSPVNVHLIKRKFESLAAQEQKRDLHRDSPRRQKTSAAESLSGSRGVSLSRASSTSSVCSLGSTTSSSTISSFGRRPLSKQCTGVAQGAVATLRQHFISLSC